MMPPQSSEARPITKDAAESKVTTIPCFLSNRHTLGGYTTAHNRFWYTKY